MQPHPGKLDRATLGQGRAAKSGDETNKYGRAAKPLLKRESLSGSRSLGSFPNYGASSTIRVSAAHDAGEQNADRVAARVMQGPHLSGAPRAPAGESETWVTGNQHSMGVAVAPQTLPGSGGHQLNADTRTFFESRFGYDFSKVRIHSDQKAAMSANSLNASAYTLGNNIVFGDSQYRPDSEEGKRLIAHELTHVLQQQHRSEAIIQRQEARQSRAAQRRADLAAARTNAIAALDRAIARVNAALTDLAEGRTMDVDVAGALTRFFPGESEQFLALLLRRMMLVRASIEHVRLRFFSGLIDIAIESVPCDTLINHNLRRGLAPAFACPQGRFIALFRGFFLDGVRNLQASRLLHECFHLNFPTFIHHHRNPRGSAFAYQGFVSILGGIDVGDAVNNRYPAAPLQTSSGGAGVE